MQPKLLRVLQDQEFERLGGTQTLKVNFRLLAATNRDLLQSVKAQEFRSDLYYRLNVFPHPHTAIARAAGGHPPLIEHFVRKYANRMNKSIISIPARTMETLVRWDVAGQYPRTGKLRGAFGNSHSGLGFASRRSAELHAESELAIGRERDASRQGTSNAFCAPSANVTANSAAPTARRPASA